MNPKSRKIPSRDDLDNAIFEHGLVNALEMYEITEEKADTILFGKADKKVERTGKWTEPKEREDELVLSMDIAKLKKVIAANYEILYNEAGAFIENIINNRSMSRYDVFAEGLKRVLSNNVDFVYFSDEQTLDYVRAYIKRNVENEERYMRIGVANVPFRDDMEHHQLEEIMIDNPLEDLSEQDRKIANLSAIGFSQQEIAEAMGVTQQTISNKLKIIHTQLRSA